MSNRLLQLEQKRLMQEYSFVKADLTYKKTILEENQSQFLKKAYEIAGKERVVSEVKNIEENKIREQQIEDSKIKFSDIDPYIKEKSKKLYREISKRTHPDRDLDGTYTEIFMEATKSYETFNLLDLYQYCEKLGISYEIEESDIILFRTEININRNQIDSVEKAFIYLWSMQPDEKMKDVIIRQFIRTVGDKM